MPDPRWFQSLYWRIAAGFVAVLALVLAAQVLVFIWVSGRASDVWPGRTPAEYAQLIAADASAVLREQPEVDLQRHLHERFPSPYRAWIVMLADRRLIGSSAVPPPPFMARATQARLGLEAPELAEAGRGGRGRRGGGGRGGGAGGGGDARPGGDGPGGLVFAPIRVADRVAGMVAVSQAPPPLSAAINNLGPALALQAFGMLCVGALLVAFVVFGPARRRLRRLQDVVREFGAGHTTVRAHTGGGDEVAALAQAFNEMAAALEERSRALADSDRVRRQLLADVSHELGTPLAAIRGYVETLSMPGAVPDDATRDRYLGIVTEETHRLDRLVGDLLDLARLEGGKPVMAAAPVALAQLVARVADSQGPALARADVTLESHVAPETLTIEGDAGRLEQALQNLVGNAIRHSPPGGVVELAARLEERQVVITVADTGPGIAEDHLARVFDRFYKADASRAGTVQPSGSGLGLSIVRAIVTAHGGRVTAANRPRGGACFEVRLPAAPSP